MTIFGGENPELVDAGFPLGRFTGESGRRDLERESGRRSTLAGALLLAPDLEGESGRRSTLAGALLLAPDLEGESGGRIEEEPDMNLGMAEIGDAESILAEIGRAESIL